MPSSSSSGSLGPAACVLLLPNPFDSESWSEAGSQPSRRGSPNRGLCTLLMRPARGLRSAIALRPSTLMHFHKMLTKQKYRMLFSSKRIRRPGPKGPTKELIYAVVEIKRRNHTWGCKRIAQRKTWSAGFSQYTSIRKQAPEQPFRN
jgi:hypothetical protein